MISIDGSNGGGQILRSALSFSSVSGKPLKLINIRKARPSPGLFPQHLAIVNAMKEICNAEAEGAKLYSEEFKFIPGKVMGGNFRFDIRTAGSTMLVLQAVMIPLLYEEKESQVVVRGGTETKWCPPSYDFKNVFLYFLEKFGVNVKFEIRRHGFYPKGGGEVALDIKPCKKLNNLELIDRGKLKKIYVFSIASGALNGVAERLVKGFLEIFKDIEVEIKYIDTLSPNCFIHCYAEFENTRIGFTCLGEKGVKAEQIGKNCAEGLKEEIESGACVDRFTADQLLIYLALAGGGQLLTSRITNHMRTNIEVIEKFLNVKFEIKNNLIICSVV